MERVVTVDGETAGHSHVFSDAGRVVPCTDWVAVRISCRRVDHVKVAVNFDQGLRSPWFIECGELLSASAWDRHFFVGADPMRTYGIDYIGHLSSKL